MSGQGSSKLKLVVGLKSQIVLSVSGQRQAFSVRSSHWKNYEQPVERQNSHSAARELWQLVEGK